MGCSMLCHFIVCSVILYSWSGAIHASPLIFNLSMEGSGYWESGKPELIPSPSVISSDPLLLEPTAMEVEGDGTKIELLTKVVDFLRENLFLILVVTSLLIIVIFIICLAMVLSRRQKVSAYYPCSYPTEMYVDETDKTGGARFFSEVPEKTPSTSMEEPTNKAKQLQEDIILATKNLRTPTKAPWTEEKNEKVSSTKSAKEETSAQADEEKEGSSCLPEEKNLEQCVSDEAEEEIRTSQDTAPVCHIEKSDLQSSDLTSENEHPSGSDDLEAREERDKQEVASTPPFISEEKTAF